MKKRYCSMLLVLFSAIILSACGNSTHESPSVSQSIEEDTQSVGSSGREYGDTLAEIMEDISEDGQKDTDESTGNSKETGGAQMEEMTVEIGGQKFQTTLYNNETVRALHERLPMTLDMEELNGNEKFYYLDEGLPANSEDIGTIKAGDIMLFGSDCLVLFFEDFSSSYNYTRIGHIEEEEAFVNALSGGTVEVTFGTGK